MRRQLCQPEKLKKQKLVESFYHLFGTLLFFRRYIFSYYSSHEHLCLFYFLSDMCQTASARSLYVNKMTILLDTSTPIQYSFFHPFIFGTNCYYLPLKFFYLSFVRYLFLVISIFVESLFFFRSTFYCSICVAFLL